MRNLSFRILFLCIFLPPVLYIFSIQGLESYFQLSWKSELKNRLISNIDELMEGDIRLSEVVRMNINGYFREKWAVHLGAEPQIVVRSQQGRLLYPLPDFEGLFLRGEGFSWKDIPSRELKADIAQRNLNILREGLELSLSVQIPRNTLLANMVLLVYILIFSSILFYSYQSRTRQVEQMTRRQQEELEEAQKRLEQAQARLEQDTDKEERYQNEISRLKNELDKADTRIQLTEQEAMGELEELEKKLQESVKHRETKEEEIHTLLKEVEDLQSQQKAVTRKKEKDFKQIMKRFQTLYKQLIFHDRSVEGFLQLPQDMHLKAEEVLHALNEDSSKVQVKRKVFCKKNTLTAFETVFAHKGRIYWHKNSESKVEVMVIGTKNTQQRDLSYLDNLF